MACENCAALESDIDYLEQRVERLSNDNDQLEIDHEKELLRLGREMDLLEEQLAERLDPEEMKDEAQFKVSLFNLQTSSGSVSDQHKLLLAKELINSLLELMGVKTCQLSV